eukprot:TRINITY_DN103497_c0_g1_i1.p1 TRINITY_DN103497_c0_g1~~TRINITY_DN103497_c0_g1_i1.p1  ORF type:complete len:165 (+),score=35.78 TRINITY_DN103497_c0_g1_i1:85-579(+)
MAAVMADVRHLKAAVFKTWILPANCKAVTQALAERQAYNSRVEGKGGKHDEGPPDVHIWRGLLAGTISDLNTFTSDEDWSEHLAKLQEHAQQSKDAVTANVVYCRPKKTFKSSTKKLQIVVSFEFARALDDMSRAWKHVHKAARMTGVDSRGGLEAELAKLLSK